VILAIESATSAGSVALVAGGKVVAETLLPPGKQHSETYLSAVGALLASRDASSAGVACIAVSAGPGSFTGLRVGMAAAKGFSFGWSVGIVPVPTLAAVAFRSPAEGVVVCPILNARKGEVYAALFRKGNEEPERITPDMAIPPEDLLARLPDGKIVFCGDGVGPFGDFFLERLGGRAAVIRGEAGLPRAGAVGILGELRFLAGGAADARSVLPSYLRPSEAERSRSASRR
jgi:tRNA threonylcarbamoyladenosine biosynthesis protein TsaB